MLWRRQGWEGLRVMSRTPAGRFGRRATAWCRARARASSSSRTGIAVARGADILAEVVGFSHVGGCAGYRHALGHQGAAHDHQCHAGRAYAARRGRLYHAHGTGTAANDKTRCAAVAHAFGHHADRLMISSTKSMHGHLIGGTGAVELLACIMALRDGIIAPTIGYEEPDPECALDVVPNEAREAQVEAVLSNAFAFGGLNAVLALRKA